jgi:hypothetical protein
MNVVSVKKNGFNNIKKRTNMTLKEKLNEKLSESFANEIEKLTDEFAIGFAEWFNNLKYDVMRYKTMEEHLEIYKKEKGL